METFKIIEGCILAAMVYGVLHDQVTARIYIQYFTVFHPYVFPTQSPTLLALGWGIIATWWVGAILRVLLAISARFGSRPTLTFRQISPAVIRLLFIMAACALLAGAIGYFAGAVPEQFRGIVSRSNEKRFLADWWAHNASYASGIVGGLILCLTVYRKRAKLNRSGAIAG